jgi:hypothetical protein
MAGETKITDDGYELTLDRSRRDGCAGLFLLVWLTGWTYGLGILGATLLAEPNLRLALLLLPMAAAEAAMLVIFAFSCTGRELLRIDGNGVQWEMWAVVRFRHRTIPLEDIESVDLLPLNPTPRDKSWAIGVLLFTGSGRNIRFGKGLDGAELHALLARVRAYIDRHRHTELAPPVLAAQIAAVSRAAWTESWHQAHPETMPEKVGGWLVVPVLVVFGCLAVFGGVKSIMSGTLWGILSGLFFTGLGLLLSVGLTCASVAVFRDWLRNR